MEVKERRVKGARPEAVERRLRSRCTFRIMTLLFNEQAGRITETAIIIYDKEVHCRSLRREALSELGCFRRLRVKLK